MKTFAPHPLRYHTWKDIGGPIGLVLDFGFCAFVIVAAGCVLAFSVVLLLLDYLVSPLLSALSRIHPFHAS